MLSNIFRKLIDLSPKLSHKGWKFFYELTANRFKKMTSWKFMNYGYANEETTSTNYDILCGNLYRNLFDRVKFTQQFDALEVGCGRGGGSELLLQYNPNSVTGVDFSKNVIEFCKKNYNDNRLNFVVGNAECLPFASNSFDVIVNIESSHCYGNRDIFFKEVARILKPSGYFLYADFMGRIYYPKRPAQLKIHGFEILFEQEITPQVLRSMELSKSFKEALLKKAVIKPFRKAISDFAGLPGSNIYNKFANGDSIYFAMVGTKPIF